MTESFRYSRALIALHWLTAALIAAAWIDAQVIDLFPSGLEGGARLAHMLFGLGLGVTLLIRIVVRSAGFGGTPPVTAGLLEGLAKLVHLLLYALMAAVVVLGIANGWARGESLFGFYTLFPAPPERALRRTIGGLHELAANAILVVAGLHAVAALFHHYVLRDSVLRRMLPAA